MALYPFEIIIFVEPSITLPFIATILFGAGIISPKTVKSLFMVTFLFKDTSPSTLSLNFIVESLFNETAFPTERFPFKLKSPPKTDLPGP